MSELTIDDLDEFYETRVGVLIFDAKYTETVAKLRAKREFLEYYSQDDWNRLVKYKLELKKNEKKQFNKR